MMESIWIMPRSTARSIDSAARQKGPRRPSRSARKARPSASSALIADAGFGEARHAAVAIGGGAEQRDRQRGARGFAEAHAEIEQWDAADCGEQPAMAGLGRAMRDPAMVDRMGVDAI